jgi:exonuclease VII small subunit
MWLYACNRTLVENKITEKDWPLHCPITVFQRPTLLEGLHFFFHNNLKLRSYFVTRNWHTATEHIGNGKKSQKKKTPSLTDPFLFPFYFFILDLLTIKSLFFACFDISQQFLFFAADLQHCAKQPFLQSFFPHTRQMQKHGHLARLLRALGAYGARPTRQQLHKPLVRLAAKAHSREGVDAIARLVVRPPWSCGALRHGMGAHSAASAFLRASALYAQARLCYTGTDKPKGTAVAGGNEGQPGEDPSRATAHKDDRTRALENVAKAKAIVAGAQEMVDDTKRQYNQANTAVNAASNACALVNNEMNKQRGRVEEADKRVTLISREVVFLALHAALHDSEKAQEVDNVVNDSEDYFAKHIVTPTAKESKSIHEVAQSVKSCLVDGTLKAARKKSKEKLANAKTELEKAEAKLEKAEAKLEKAKTELKEAEAKLEKAKTELEKAEAKLEKAKKELEKAVTNEERAFGTLSAKSMSYVELQALAREMIRSYGARAEAAWKASDHTDTTAIGIGILGPRVDEMTAIRQYELQRVANGARAPPPMIGLVPYVEPPMLSEAVNKHIALREAENAAAARIAPLANFGAAGSGKTTLLYATAVRATMMLADAVKGHKLDEWKHRPLGMYLSFNDKTSDSTVADRSFEARVAIRILYNVYLHSDTVLPGEDERGPKLRFTQFGALFEEVAAKGINATITLLREAMDWQGPLFLAIDEVKKAFMRFDSSEEIQTAAEGLSQYCSDVLDARTEISCHLSYTACPRIFSLYTSVSVYDALSITKMSTGSGRPVIGQPTVALNLFDLSALWKLQRDAVQRKQAMPYRVDGAVNFWEQLFERPLDASELLLKKVLSNNSTITQHEEDELYMALLAKARTTFVALECIRPRSVSQIVDYLADVKDSLSFSFKPGHRVFWSTNAKNETPGLPEGTTLYRRRLAQCFVVGAHDVCLFSLDTAKATVDMRAVLLDPWLAGYCTLTNPVTTRVVVSPKLLNALAVRDAPDFAFLAALSDSLDADATKAKEFVLPFDVSSYSVPQSRQARLVAAAKAYDEWRKGVPRRFEEMMFYALGLRFQQLLDPPQLPQADAQPALVESVPLSRLLGTVSAKSWGDTTPLSVRAGPLRLVRGVQNFPAFHMDYFGDAPVGGGHAAARVRPSPSLAALQAALQAGESFCFLPENDSNHAEDGVFFLRDAEGAGGAGPRWLVVLMQYKHRYDAGELRAGRSRSTPSPQPEPSSLLDTVRSVLGFLFESLAVPAAASPGGASGAAAVPHTFRYVRALVTTNRLHDADLAKIRSGDGRPKPRRMLGTTQSAARTETKSCDLLPEQRSQLLNLAHRNVVELHRVPLLLAVTHSKKQFWRATQAFAAAEALHRNQQRGSAHTGAEERHVPVEDFEECALCVKDVSDWCPTVGLYAGNLAFLHPISWDAAPSDMTSVEQK